MNIISYKEVLLVHHIWLTPISLLFFAITISEGLEGTSVIFCPLFKHYPISSFVVFIFLASHFSISCPYLSKVLNSKSKHRNLWLTLLGKHAPYHFFCHVWDPSIKPPTMFIGPLSHLNSFTYSIPCCFFCHVWTPFIKWPTEFVGLLPYLDCFTYLSS